MLKIEVGDVINEWQKTNSVLVVFVSVDNTFTSGLPKIIKQLSSDMYSFYKNCRKEFTKGVTLLCDDIFICCVSQNKKDIDFEELVSCLQRAPTGTTLTIAMPDVGDQRRIIAIMEAVFHDVDATLYLKE